VTHDGLAIEGIDTEAALKRLGGKRERYEALLRKFADKQANTVVVVRAALATGDLAAAELEVHSLKGAAASLGAVGLSDAASAAETALRAGTGIDAALETLAASLDGAVKAIHARLPG